MSARSAMQFMASMSSAKITCNECNKTQSGDQFISQTNMSITKRCLRCRVRDSNKKAEARALKKAEKELIEGQSSQAIRAPVRPSQKGQDKELFVQEESESDYSSSDSDDEASNSEESVSSCATTVATASDIAMLSEPSSSSEADDDDDEEEVVINTEQQMTEPAESADPEPEEDHTTVEGPALAKKPTARKRPPLEMNPTEAMPESQEPSPVTSPLQSQKDETSANNSPCDEKSVVPSAAVVEHSAGEPAPVTQAKFESPEPREARDDEDEASFNTLKKFVDEDSSSQG